MFFLTLFFLGSSISSTSLGTCSGASRFRVGFEVGFLDVLGGVLAGLGVDFFFLPILSTESFGKGKTGGGPEL